LPNDRRGYRLRAIGLSEEEQEGFYLGFSNQVIWPLFHGFPERCDFHPRYWEIYAEVNRKFARGVAGHLGGDELVWIHDYHLMGVAEVLRQQGVRQPVAFFLHTPVPAPDLLRKLPWRLPLLRSLLSYDLVGFQTGRDRENFVRTVRWILPKSRIEPSDDLYRIRMGTQTTNVGVFPISIDVPEFADAAESEPVRRESLDLRRGLPGFSEEDPDSHIMLLGVDRLDYTKGLIQKLKAFQLMLRRHPELRRSVTLVQLVVPSREDIPAYHSLKREVERLVGEVCGEFNEAGWCPIRYEYGRWDRERLVAHYRAARVALVTPLQDGMNLVAKEYCAANVEGDGVLVLSEHAGAAAQFHLDALLVNPYDVEGLAWAIYRACTMPAQERRARMRRLRSEVSRHDIHWWAHAFLKAARRGSDRRAKRRTRLRSRLSGPLRRSSRRPHHPRGDRPGDGT
jgi:trehalose 6-phosphate synthase/phosphatase